MGLLSATTLNWLWHGKPDLGMTVNGCLAGLVAITASCAFVTVPGRPRHWSARRAATSICAVKLLDKWRIDDPVGAVPVHLFNGVFGTLCVGLFAVDKIPAWRQAMVSSTAAARRCSSRSSRASSPWPRIRSWPLSSSGTAIKAVLGLRVSPAEEEEGLDIGEHGQVAYTGFTNL